MRRHFCLPIDLRFHDRNEVFQEIQIAQLEAEWCGCVTSLLRYNHCLDAMCIESKCSYGKHPG